MQRNHYNTSFSKRTFPITLICDNVTNAANIGSLFRIADAFGVNKLILCGNNPELGRKMKKTSRATENVVNYEIYDDVINLVHQLKSEDYQIIALEITEKSQPLHNFKFSNERPFVLVVGSENFGISEALLELCDSIIHIEMFGQNSSMNVVQAANIVLFEITRQFL